MQATVRGFDPVTGTGDVLLDDGSARPFDAAAFAASGLLRLRIGQRVRLRLDDSGRITFLTIATLPDPTR